jgi:hypothetical protein
MLALSLIFAPCWLCRTVAEVAIRKVQATSAELKHTRQAAMNAQVCRWLNCVSDSRM